MSARILVVDDEEMNRDLLSRRLAKHDYEVSTAESAYEALAMLDEEQFDLIILDVMMPGMSGMEMLTVIRQKFSRSQMPIIMATAKSDSEDVVEALNKGANDHVAKPLDMPVVLAHIERSLSERQTTAALEKLNKDLLNKSRSPIGNATTHLSVDMTAMSDFQKSKPKKPKASVPSINGKIGKYEILSTLGNGGSGKVYLAYDPLIEREVAIKVLSPEYSENDVWVQRFLLEAKAARKLEHPNIIAIYDVNVFEESFYIVMEYAEGGTLKKRTVKNGPLKLSETCRCIIEAARGLQAAHESNLVHRDVKPDNLMLSSTDEVKVGDFGIVKNQDGGVEDPELTCEGRRLGTPLYMSPEQIRMQEVDARTDVYGLGGTFYFLLTGNPPFSGKSIDDLINSHVKDPRPDPLQVNPDLPPACSEIIAKAMAVDPNRRYQTMLEFIEDMEKLRDSLADN